MLQFVKRLKQEEGFSLVEMLAVSLIVTLIGGVLFSILHFGTNTYGRITVEQQLREDADYLMSLIMMEIYNNAPEMISTYDNGFVMSGGEITEDRTVHFDQGKLYIGNVSVEIDSTVASDSLIEIQCANEQANASCSTGLIDIKLVLEGEYAENRHRLELVSKLGF